MLEVPLSSALWIKRLDPRIKIMWIGLYSVVLALCYRFEVLMIGLGISVFLTLCSGVPIKEILKRLIPVNIFMVLVWVFLPFTHAGTPIYQIWMFTITKEGVWYAWIITVKSNALMLMLILLILSTPLVTIGNAIQQLGLPQKLVYLLFFTYRYIHVIQQEYIRLSNAMKIRGFVPKTNLLTYKSYAYLVGMLLVKSVERAKRVHNAMRCRGFCGKFYCLNEYHLSQTDYIASLMMCVMLCVMVTLEWRWIVLS